MRQKNEAFGKKLRELRRAKKLTQEKLGKEIGVSNQVICAWENTNSLPEKALVAKLERFFGTQLEGMLTRPSTDSQKTSQNKSSAAKAPSSARPAAKNAPDKKPAPAPVKKTAAHATKTDTKRAAPAEHAHDTQPQAAKKEQEPIHTPDAHDEVGEYTPAIAIYAIVADSAREDARLFSDTYKSMIITMLEGALAEFKK